MAANTRKRIPVKWIRDKAKAAYIKTDRCYICETRAELELHHLNSITLLFVKWCELCGHCIDTDEDVLAIRDEFIAAHHDELYGQVYTLCNEHHKALHAIYGKSPAFGSAPKQKRWIDIQREKYEGTYIEPEIPLDEYGNPRKMRVSPEGELVEIPPSVFDLIENATKPELGPDKASVIETKVKMRRSMFADFI